MQKYITLLVVFGISYITAEAPVYDCDNGVPLPLSTEVFVDQVECKELPCELPQGSNINMIAVFKAGVTTGNLTPQVIAYALGVEVDYPLGEPDGCNALIDMSCPIEEGETVRYLLEMPVLEIFPTVSLKFKFTMYDENNDGMVCFMMDAKVVSPNKKETQLLEH